MSKGGATYYLFNFTRKGAAKGKTLRDQATELLTLKLWGIGAGTPFRDNLKAGDRTVIYVGAPEQTFIGDVVIGSSVHEWTAEEAAKYPGSFGSGVGLEKATPWPLPVSLPSALPKLVLSKTNPKGRFFSGVVRIKEEDYETLLSMASQKIPEGPTSAPAGPMVAFMVGLLFETTEKLKKLMDEAVAHLSESDTRAFLIDKYLQALGWVDLSDVQHEVPVGSGNFLDYLLRVGGKPVVAIEAKKLGTEIGEKQAAQVVSYCSALGVRWGGVTDGRFLKIYDAPVLGLAPHERLILELDLAGYKDKEDFEARILPELELLSKRQLEEGGGLERRVTQEAVREILTSPDSKGISGLRKDLQVKKGIKISATDLADLVSEVLG